MRTSTKLLAATVLSLSTAGLHAQLHGDPFLPVGSLDISQKMVRSGKKASMDWDISYPMTIPDLLIPQPGGQVITKEDVIMRVRIVGVAFQSGSTNLPAKFETRISAVTGNAWVENFHGTEADVNPTEVVFEAFVPANSTVDFRAKGKKGGDNNAWYGWRSTNTSDVAVTGLLNGDTPPSYAPAYAQGSIEDFLSGYISEDNTFQIGPRDMIYLFELASRNPGDWWFDMQDVVAIVTWEPVGS